MVRLYPHLFCKQPVLLRFIFCLSKTLRHCFGGALAEVSTYIEHPQQPTGGIAPFFSHSCVMVLMEPSEEPKHFYSWMFLFVPMIWIFGAVFLVKKGIITVLGFRSLRVCFP